MDSPSAANGCRNKTCDSSDLLGIYMIIRQSFIEIKVKTSCRAETCSIQGYSLTIGSRTSLLGQFSNSISIPKLIKYSLKIHMYYVCLPLKINQIKRYEPQTILASTIGEVTALVLDTEAQIVHNL